MIDLSIRRPVATAALYVALVALGAYSFRFIPVELLPNVEYPRLSVTASWPGASPEALEAFVTAPLEAAAQRVQGVRSVTSVSRADPQGTGSTANIEIEFGRDTRMEFARLALSERIAALRDELPPGALRPQVEPYVPEEFARENTTFLSYRVTGPYTFSRLAQIAEEQVRPVLLGIEGVADVNIYGGRGREVAVVLDREAMDARGVRLADVRARLGNASVVRAPGSVRLNGREVVLAVRTRAASAEELGRLAVAERPTGAVRLGDIADVRVQTEEARSYFRINGQPTISVSVARDPGTNAVQLADVVKAEIEPVRATLPPGVNLALDADLSEDIRAELADLRLRATAAAVVIFLVLLIFLRSLGSTLVVFATIAFSVLIAVNLLYLGGFSLNVLTLAGLAWGFGLMVDNGIVVLENIERHLGLERNRRLAADAGTGPGGRPENAEVARAARRRASAEGARQVALPVLAATATTAIVLVPFLFLQGELRLYYVPLAWAVGFSNLGSLLVGFTFVPAMTARFKWAAGPKRATAERGDTSGNANSAGPSDGSSSDGSVHTRSAARPPFYARGYRALLEWALDHPFVVAFVCVGALGGSWWLFDQHVTRGIKWSSFWGQRTYISVYIDFPRGAGLERTDGLAREFEAKIASLPPVERFETRVYPRSASIEITFPEDVERTALPVAIKEQMVAFSHGFSGAEVRVYGYGPSFYGGGGSPPNYSVQVLGYNYLEVRDIAVELAGLLKRFSRIRDVDPNASGSFFDREKAFEYALAVDREALGARDLSVEELLRFVGANVRGGIAGEEIRIGGEELPISLKLAGYQEFDLLDLRQLRVPSASEEAVRLGDVADVKQRDVLALIRREDQQYERTVAWEFRGPRKLGDIVRDAVLESVELPPGYRIDTEAPWWSWDEEEQTQVYLALVFSIILIYMVTAALFESLSAPLVILLTIPLAMIGVFLIFFYTDASFTRTAYIGTIMMGGIVVNNAILIVYHIGDLRRHLPTREAIVRGTVERVRPILMTTCTTVFGLLPLVLFAQSQDENIWNALALATIGGLLSSTVFVLVAIPVAYRWLMARGRA